MSISNINATAGPSSSNTTTATRPHVRPAAGTTTGLALRTTTGAPGPRQPIVLEATRLANLRQDMVQVVNNNITNSRGHDQLVSYVLTNPSVAPAVHAHLGDTDKLNLSGVSKGVREALQDDRNDILRRRDNKMQVLTQLVAGHLDHAGVRSMSSVNKQARHALVDQFAVPNVVRAVRQIVAANNVSSASNLERQGFLAGQATQAYTTVRIALGLPVETQPDEALRQLIVMIPHIPANDDANRDDQLATVQVARAMLDRLDSNASVNVVSRLARAACRAAQLADTRSHRPAREFGDELGRAASRTFNGFASTYLDEYPEATFFSACAAPIIDAVVRTGFTAVRTATSMLREEKVANRCLKLVQECIGRLNPGQLSDDLAQKITDVLCQVPADGKGKHLQRLYDDFKRLATRGQLTAAQTALQAAGR